MDRRPYPERAKDKIRATKLATRLQKHAMGKVEMSATQVRSAEILLKKVWPDLKSTELSGHVSGDKPKVLNEKELDAAIERQLARPVTGEEEKS